MRARSRVIATTTNPAPAVVLARQPKRWQPYRAPTISGNGPCRLSDLQLDEPQRTLGTAFGYVSIDLPKAPVVQGQIAALECRADEERQNEGVGCKQKPRQDRADRSRYLHRDIRHARRETTSMRPHYADAQCAARSSGAPVEHRAQDISVSDAVIRQRQRFSICHELGHWHYHRGKSLYCRADDIRERPGVLAAEQVANVFASDLLLPSYLLLPIGRKYRSTYDQGTEGDRGTFRGQPLRDSAEAHQGAPQSLDRGLPRDNWSPLVPCVARRARALVSPRRTGLGHLCIWYPSR